MNRPRIISGLGLALLLLGTCNGAATAGATKTAPDQSERLQIMSEAEDAYELGMALEVVDPPGARAAFGESADGWNRLIGSGADNGRIWTNLGNSEFRGGRLGEAIAAYLEADRLLPGNETVRANLALARNSVPARFDAEGVTVLYDTVSDGWHVLGFELRWWLAGVTWVGFWLLLALRFTLGRRDAESEGPRLAWRGGLVILAVASIASGATVALDASEDAWRSPGVLLAETVVRSGNGDTFKPVFSEPLPAGVEFELVESRPGWDHVAFADGRGGWVRSDHAHLVGK